MFEKVLSLLLSTKAKDRNAAFSELEAAYTSFWTDLTDKQFLRLSDIVLDQAILEKTQSKQTRWLQLVMQVLRANGGREPRRLAKLVIKLVPVLELNLSDPERIDLNSEYLRIMSILIQNARVVNDLSFDDHTKLVGVLLAIAQLEMNNSHFERFLFRESLNTLSNCVSFDPNYTSPKISISKSDTTGIVPKLLKFILTNVQLFCYVSTADMTVILKLANFCIINYTLQDIASILELITSMIPVISQLNVKNYPLLQDQLAIFLLMSTEIYQFHHSATGYPQQSRASVHEALKSLISFYIRTLTESSAFELPPEAVTFLNFDVSRKAKTWFQFGRVSLNDTSAGFRRSWLLRLSFARVLWLYFDFQTPLNDDNNDESMLKKRRVDHYSSVNLHGCCDNIVTYLEKLVPLETDLVCQTIMFLEDSTVVVSFGEFLVDYLMSSINASIWKFYAIKKILDMRACSSGPLLDTLPIVMVENLNSEAFCDISCSCLHTIIIDLKAVQDSSLFRSILELPAVNGPAKINNYSIMLWFDLQIYFTNDPKVNKILKECFVIWFNSKSVDDVDELMLEKVLLWLWTSQDIDGFEDESSTVFKDLINDSWVQWEQSAKYFEEYFCAQAPFAKSSSYKPKATYKLKNSAIPYVNMKDHEKLMLKLYDKTKDLTFAKTSSEILAHHDILNDFEKFRVEMRYILQDKWATIDQRCFVEFISDFKNFSENKKSIVSELINLPHNLKFFKSDSATESVDDFGEVRKKDDKKNASKSSGLQKIANVTSAKHIRTHTQILFKYLIWDNFDYALFYLKSLDFDAFLECLVELNRNMFQCINKVLENVNEISKMIGEKLLSTFSKEQNEIVFSAVFDFICLMRDKCLDQKSSTVANFEDIYSYLDALGESLMTKNSIICYEKLLLLGFTDSDSKSNTNKNKKAQALSTLSVFISRNSNLMNLEVSSFIKNLKLPDSSAVYKTLYESLSNPESSTVSFFAFTKLLRNVSRSSYQSTANFLFNLLEFSGSSEIFSYASHNIKDIRKDLNFDNSTILFEKFSIILIKLWHLFGNEYSKFPFDLFGYKDLRHFLKNNYRIITAVHISSETKFDPTLLSNIENKLQLSIDELVKRSIPYSISLAYTKYGCRNDVFTRLEMILGANFPSSMNEWFVCNVSTIYKYTHFKEVQKSSRASMISISPNTAEALLDQLNKLNKSGPGREWTVQEVYFVARDILSQSEKSFDKVERLEISNQILSFSRKHLNLFKSNDVLILLVVHELLPFCNEAEIARRLVEFLKQFPAIPSQAVYEIGTVVLDNGSNDESVIEFLGTQLSDSETDHVLKLFHKKVPNTSAISLDNHELEEILKMPLKDNVWIKKYVPLAVKHTPELSNIKITDIPSNSVANILLKWDGPTNSEFLIYKGRYIGNFFSRSGISLKPTKSKKSFIQLQKVLCKGKGEQLIYLILRNLINYLKVSCPDSCEDTRIIELCLGSIKFSANTLSLNFEELLTQHGLGHLNFDSSEYLKFYYDKEASADYPSALTEYTVDIINQLSSEFSCLEGLKYVILKVPAFLTNETAIYLIFFYIHQSQENSKKFYDQFSQKVGCFENKSLYLELFMKLRLAEKLQLKNFEYNWDKNFGISAFEAACYFKHWKEAMLIYEAYCDAVGVSDSHRLRPVYENIKEPDIDRSLILQPTLDTAMNAVSSISDDNPFNRLMLNSALLDSGSSDSGTNLIKSLDNAGFNGLARMAFDHYSGYSSKPLDLTKDDKFKWAWNLDSWELSVDNENMGYNETIYNLLKTVHSGKYETLKSSYLNVVSKLEPLDQNRYEHLIKSPNGNFVKDVSKLKPGYSYDYEQNIQLLSVIWNIENVVSLTEENCESFNKIQQESSYWYLENDFESYENIILSRLKALWFCFKENARVENVPNSLSFSKWDGMITKEFSRYCDLARDNNQNQKVINLIMHLKGLVGNSLNENETIRNALEIETASFFWSQRSSSLTAISMLKNVRERNVLQSNQFSPDPMIDSKLVQWLDESKQESSNRIMQEYIDPYYEKNEPYTSKAVTGALGNSDLFHTYAKFCDDQLKSSKVEQEIKRYERIIANRTKDLKETLKVQTHNMDAKKYAYKLRKQLKSDSIKLNALMHSKRKYVEYSIFFYLKSIITNSSGSNLDFDIDRIFAMWFQYSDVREVNEKVKSSLLKPGEISYSRFLPWINQIISRMLSEDNAFQIVLKRLLFNICCKYPFHCLYSLKSLELEKLFDKDPDTLAESRRAAATDMLAMLSSSSNEFHTKFVEPVVLFCTESLKLANLKVNDSDKRIKLSSNSFWVRRLPQLSLVNPTKKITGNADYVTKRIVSVASSTIEISSSGLSKPKILSFKQGDGTISKILFKGNTDDLKQDNIMEQVFEKVNKLLYKDRESKRRNLKMRTYKVVPLGTQAGLIEFVMDSIPFIDIISPLHSKYDKLSFSKAVKKMKAWQNLEISEKIANFKTEFLKNPDTKIEPVFRKFFFKNYLLPSDWFDVKTRYTRGTAACSIIGYILGLGDRHCNNILIDKSTGEPIHIDLGVAFDQGKLLSIPETVPFRLTRDIVDGMGVCGTEGIFRRSCEEVFRVLRERKVQIDGILEILKWDPLYSWTVSPLRKRKLQTLDESNFNEFINSNGNANDLMAHFDDGFEAARAISGVKEKLEADGLSSDAVVRQLIQEASDVNNLALIFCGWAPFY